MAIALDLTGSKIGRLTPVERAQVTLSSGRKMPAWKCRCDCGNDTTVLTTNLRKPGHTTSCGCVAREVASVRSKTHGASQTRPYGVWRAMLDRCYNEHDYHFQWYGARGIAVCDRWRFGDGEKTAFECWRDDMGPKPTPKHTLDRRDNDGNYEPDNCRWATMKEQRVNRRPALVPRPSSTHCRRGHPLSKENIYIVNGVRRCKTCQRERSRLYYQRKMSAAA